MTLALRYAVRSDVGLLREGNEDSAYASPRLLAVADGMGGHAAGEVASAVAIAAVAELDVAMPGDDLLGALKEAVHAASETLHEMTCADPSVEGMGTTLTAMLWSGQGYALCHIGDSRAYVLRDGELYQITHDHSLVQSLVDDGRISAEEAATHPQRSLILRALDGRGEAEPDLSMREAMAGDRYLLCSDGLSDVVSDETLQQTLSSVPGLEDVAVQLVDLAIRGGGPDNITVIVADAVDSDTSPLPPASVPVLVGAASNGSVRGLGPVADMGTPASRAGMLAHTTPQAAVMLEDADVPPGGGGGHWPADGDGPDAGDWPGTGPAGQAGPPWEEPGSRRRARQEQRATATARRRWPIVTTALTVLAAVIVGGGYAAWNYTQHQYYLGTDAGQVTIFRGINQRLAGFSLSSVYDRTGVPVQAVPSQEMQMIKETVTTTGLSDAERIVGQLRQQIQQCRSAYTQRAAWEKQLKASQASKKTSRSKKANPLPPEPAVPAYCPSAAAVGVSGAGS
jgi:serine/threonine protein phosphatase PrpC